MAHSQETAAWKLELPLCAALGCPTSPPCCPLTHTLPTHRHSPLTKAHATPTRACALRRAPRRPYGTHRATAHENSKHQTYANVSHRYTLPTDMSNIPQRHPRESHRHTTQIHTPSQIHSHANATQAARRTNIHPEHTCWAHASHKRTTRVGRRRISYPTYTAKTQDPQAPRPSAHT